MNEAFGMLGTALAVNYAINSLILAAALACTGSLGQLPSLRFLALAIAVTFGGYLLDIAFLSPYWGESPAIFLSAPGEVYLQMALPHAHKPWFMAGIGVALCAYDYVLARLVFRFDRRPALACSLAIGLLTNPFYLLP